LRKKIIILLDDDLDRKLRLKQAKNQSKKLIVTVMFFIFITNYVLPYQFIQDAIAESKEPGSDLQQNNDTKKNLIVSAANPLFENNFGGPMVVEVIVSDLNLNDLDEEKGEPDVTINGNDLRMAQAIDGNWYAYFADKTMATRADETNLTQDFTDTAGSGLDFGGFCGPGTTDTDIVGSSGGFPQTEGFAIARSFVGEGTSNIPGLVEVVPTQGTATFVSCVFIGPSDDPDDPSEYRPGVDNHVVRQAKQLNTNPNAAGIGQIGLVAETWPIIQLFDFEPRRDVVIFYNRGGDPQTVTLRFDNLDDLTHVKFDRDFHPQNSELHITLIDGQLNIDPTDEDSWTFDTETSSLAIIYQMYDESGNDDSQGDGDTEVDISGNLRSLGYGNNGLFEIIRDAQNVGSDVVREDSSSLIVGSTPVVPLQFDVTMVETGPNTGIFVSYDWEDNSNVDIETDAKRGTSATIKYSDRMYSVVVGNSFGTITMNSSSVGNEWNSGEEIPVTLVDQDLNLNTRADEDLDLNNPAVTLVPSLQTGDPFTLAENGTSTDNGADTIQATLFQTFNATVGSGTAPFRILNMTHLTTDSSGLVATNTTATTVNVDKFSDIGRMTFARTNATALIIDLETTAGELQSSIVDPSGTLNNAARFHGFNLLNIDVRGLNSSITSVDVWLLNTTTATPILSSGGALPVDGYAQTNVPVITALKLATGVTPLSLTSLNSTVVTGTDFGSTLTTAPKSR